MFSDLTVTRRFMFCDPLQTSELHIKFDGIPFLILGKKIMECHHGPYRDLEPPKRKCRIVQNYVWHLCVDFVKNWFIIYYDLSENAALLIYNLAGLCYVLMLYIFHRYVLLFSWIKETSIFNLPSPLLWRRGDIIDLHLSVGQLISSFVE